MPTIEENLQVWDGKYNSSQTGNEWSQPWGSVEAEWYGTIFPRIHAFVPTGTILEIAPGYGRWTQMLKKMCEHLVVVDLSRSCIKACKRRFRADNHITYHVNDGKSLAMVADGSIDFAFSFASLTIVEADVIEAYVTQLARKLTPNGIGFIHHSNIGEYVDSSTGELPFYIKDQGWHAKSMTARRFREFCEAAGMQCIAQELVNWGKNVSILNECYSLFTHPNSVWSRSNRVLINSKFMDEVHYLNQIMSLYTASSFKKTKVRKLSRDLPDV